MIILLAVLVILAAKDPVPRTKRCLACDAGRHHPGKDIEGCDCSTCGSGLANA